MKYIGVFIDDRELFYPFLRIIEAENKEEAQAKMENILVKTHNALEYDGDSYPPYFSLCNVCDINSIKEFE